MGIGNKQEHERSDVYVACNGRMVGVQYRVALEPEHGRVQVVFCMAHSNLQWRRRLEALQDHLHLQKRW